MKWILIASLSILLLGSTAWAQTLDANRLALHNGGEYYVGAGHHPNSGAGKYYPSFAHWSASGTPTGWPWHLRGYVWAGMQGNNHGPTWFWLTALQYSVDNPWSTGMTFNYPVNYCLGLEPHSGPPWPVYGGVPSLINIRMVFPSSYGGFDAYMNIFAMGNASWSIPSTAPFYGYEFAFVTLPSNFIALPSGHSVYQYIWDGANPYGQYLILSGNEVDSTLNSGGNKARGYSIGRAGGGPYFYYWNNACTGVDSTWDMALLVNDAVTIPVNVPGVPNNPFAQYGFDVGVATLMPRLSVTSVLKVMYEDVFNPGTDRALLAASPYSGPCVPYGPLGRRIPHAWDAITQFFANIWWVWGAESPGIVPGYPAATFGTTVGGHSASVPIPYSPSLLCLELKFSAFSTDGCAPTASFMICIN